VKADADNGKAPFAALARFGAPLEGITVADFSRPGPFFRIGHEPVSVDTLTRIPGVDVDAAWERRVEDVIDETTGLKADFISADDLIASKEAAGRLQDFADADAVRKAQRLKPAEKSKPK
jgi:hypothetical protein